MVSSRKSHKAHEEKMSLTGRRSCQEPNIQNIPIRTETGAIIRAALVEKIEGQIRERGT